MEVFKIFKWLCPFIPLTLGFADDNDEAGDDNKGEKETVSKAEFDKISGERDKLLKEMDDVRAEIFTPEYLDFLDSKEKGDPNKDKNDVIDDDALDKMSKKEILDLAVKQAEARMEKKLSVNERRAQSAQEARLEREVRRFAKTHDDFEKIRPVMYGLSLKPENKDLGLQELYDIAKQHIKSLQEEPTEEEKKKQRAMSGMKPEQTSGSYSFDKKIDANTAAREALEEVSETLGPLPSA